MSASTPASAMQPIDARGFGQFVFEDQRVERQITPHAPAVQRSHRFRQFAKFKANLRAGAEVFEAEIAGIRASFDRRVELRPMSGRTHHFGFLRERHGLLNLRVACRHQSLASPAHSN